MKAIRLAHSELTGTIYAIIGRTKIDITEQAIAEVKAIKALEEEPKTDVLDKISDELKKAGSLCVAYAGKERTEEEVDELVRYTLEQARRQVLEMIDKYRKEG